MASRYHRLNGAYYDPPIQPPPYQNHGRRHPTDRSFLLCFFGCLFKIICIIFVGAIFFLGFVALYLGFTLRPNYMTFQVTEANLTRFNLDPLSNNLHYNISLNFSIRNPNQRLGIHYDQIEARGYYGDLNPQRLAAVNIPPFYQGERNTTVVGTELNGQRLVSLCVCGLKQLNEDHTSGIYRIDVKLRLKIRFKIRYKIRHKFWVLNSFAVKPKLKCHLKVPLSSSSLVGGFQFHPTYCYF